MIINNLLKEGIEKNYVIKTDQRKKYNIWGQTMVYDIYKIDLDALYFNDKNDRIATWISKYKAEHNNEEFDTNDRENYNNIIQEFIVDSNQGAIDRTQSNIDLIGQREPGIVLNDGRIIDGNRRFTCLRRLKEQNSMKNRYFEAIILNFDLKHNEKQIKVLELQIQLGEDTKIDYNPIDRLVGIYNDLISKQLLTVQEYADATNEKPSEIEKKIELANLMVDYLDYINMPLQFYIARENDIEGPLHEILRTVHKCKTEEDADNIKQILFHELLMRPEGDMTRYIRKTADNLVSSKYAETFIEESFECIEETQKQLLAPENQSLDKKELINKVRNNNDIRENMKRSRAKLIEKNDREKIANQPVELLNKSIDTIEQIDTNIFKKLSDVQLEDVKNSLSRLEDLLNVIRLSIEE
jgi:hypothetical protein